VPRPLDVPPLGPVAFAERKVLLRLGYRKGRAAVARPVLELVAEETRRAAGLLRPAVAAALLDKDELPPLPVFLGAEKAALCVCTIGPDLEDAVALSTAEGDLLRGLVLDWLGSEAVADVSRQVHAWMRREARGLGLVAGKRFSPGYKGWGLSGQELIFASVPAAAIGVRLSESSMMRPRKSCSFRVNFSREGPGAAPAGRLYSSSKASR
jgi:hypothetical protein